MAPILDNEAAWLESLGHPLKVGPGPQPDPADDEVVIIVAYAAVNPLDWKASALVFSPSAFLLTHLIPPSPGLIGSLQDGAHPVDTPHILGADVSGTVVQLGRKVTRFQIGQRVIGFCDGLIINNKAKTGYQRYSTLSEIMITAIPDSLPLANAVVLPLSISTAAMGLFVKLGLPLPSFNPEPTGKSILIWGGSSSMGCTAIQFAVAAGYEVITTASPANFDLVKSLGAAHVFNHKDSDIVEKVAKVLTPRVSNAFDCIASAETQKVTSEILSKIGGGKLALLNPLECPFPDNVEPISVFAYEPGLMDSYIGEFIWQTYVPEGLANGKLKAKPEPMVIEGGLAKVQEGIDLLRKGVSGKKIVIEIQK
ncbi:zinc binding dehydrogenase, putative [Talaromyces stipitatus ATCC 10500]|uniref:Zinc binding dehydrogenase, putative n=1 Tax=Talaromyces stipitatus (strain ATCC 10500 / CBS 375.48 / QM 6759 / NRRL 1006) TaxID=441959 RepID=B8M321_TALSN|nr:zinc binding dehydrogenase, putative [Talaromyces stipitatus ATCC 10500]EED21997.1 zinc binding dehydrogenase, putative [Talaromyces stipitatus ATCC 10500]